MAFPTLALAVIIQSAVISRISLLSGYADLSLIIVISWTLQKGVTTGWHWAILAGIMTSIVTGLPWGVPFIGYLLAVVLAKSFQRRIWQAPLINVFTVTFLASLVNYLLIFAVLLLLGGNLPINDTLSHVILPSILLNLLFTIPIFWLIRDLARWTHPVEEDA